MGGSGSGRKPWAESLPESCYRRIDVRRLHRSGLLKPGATGRIIWTSQGGTVELNVLGVQAEAEGMWLWNEPAPLRRQQYFVPLSRTPCFKGGARLWFHCPVTACNRRVAVLFGSDLFLCRHCRGLSYDSQRANAFDRQIIRMNRLREQLGWPGGPLDLRGDKPKGMHWRTFNRLAGEYEQLYKRVEEAYGYR